MEEDVLGPRETVVGDRYDYCTRCGRALLRSEATIPRLPGEGPPRATGAAAPARPPEATREAQPAVLCPVCAADVAAGEPLEPIGAAETNRPTADMPPA
jgi:hypothetical protein